MPYSPTRPPRRRDKDRRLLVQPNSTPIGNARIKKTLHPDQPSNQERGRPMPNRDLVVIGASAGGIGALQQLCAALPSHLNAAVLIVVPTSASSSNLLPNVLRGAGCLSAMSPVDGDLIKKGNIYVAPPDYHLIVDGHHLRLIRGPRENHYRPAIDPTFRSAALCYGPRVIAVVLSGSLDDGTA